MQAEPDAVAEVEPEGRQLALEADLLRRGETRARSGDRNLKRPRAPTAAPVVPPLTWIFTGSSSGNGSLRCPPRRSSQSLQEPGLLRYHTCDLKSPSRMAESDDSPAGGSASTGTFSLVAASIVAIFLGR